MIGSILDSKRPLISVGRDTSVHHILALLHDHRIGAVLVMDAGRIAGLVSERDIVRCLHSHGKAILDESAADIMTSPVFTTSPHTSVSDALAIMTDRRFRHLPVVDGNQVLGLVSIGDLVKRRIEDAEAEAESLKHYITS